VVASAPMRSRAISLGLGVALGLVVGQAAADPEPAKPAREGTRAAPDAAADRARARDAYDRAEAAHERGDHAAAARELALADAILPSPTVLESAIEEALAADDPVLGMTLCDRAPRGPVEGPLAAAVQRARARFSRRVGRVRADCGGATACAAAIDGSPVDPGRLTVVGVGRHVVSLEHDGRAEQRSIDVEPEGTIDLLSAGVPFAPPDRGEPPPPPARAPSPAWFLAALGSTAVAAGVTAGLAADTASKHDRFVAAGCPGPVHGNCAAAASDGLAETHATSALLGVTAALAAATVVAGILTFRARSATGAERVALSIVPGDPRARPSSIGVGPGAVLRVPLP
jgi:hypothetical protein